jgi:hypothetical protein
MKSLLNTQFHSLDTTRQWSFRIWLACLPTVTGRAEMLSLQTRFGNSRADPFAEDFVFEGREPLGWSDRSTNAPIPGCRRTSSAVVTRRFRSSHATCNSLAVRLIPSFPATSTAADQSSLGIRAFPPATASPFFETSSYFLQRHNRALVTSHYPPPCRISGGRTTLKVIDGTIHASLPQTHFHAPLPQTHEL